MTQAPKHAGNYPDREIDCEAALEAYIDQAMAAAEKFGWTRDEAAHALLRLAGANVLKLGGRLDPDAALADLMEAAKD